jgi:hypothetical protein
VRRRSQTVCAAQVALGQSAGRIQTVDISGCTSGGSVAFNGLFARGLWTVRPVLADRSCNTRKFHHNKILLATWFSFNSKV